MASKYEYYDTGLTSGQYVYGTRRQGQSFTIGSVGANENLVLTSIKIQSKRVGTPGNVTIELYAEDGSDQPTGSALSTGIVSANGWATSSAMHEVTMSSYELVAGTKYVFTIKCAGASSSDSIVCYYDSSGATYGGGIRLYDSNWSNPLSEYVDADQGFEIWGDPPASNPSIKLSGTFGNKPIKFKSGGSFGAATMKVKVSGTFQ